MTKKTVPPEICPICREDVPRNARACPECGADERSGWKSDAAVHDGLDLPDAEFNYEDFVAREFGGVASRSTKQVIIAAVAALLLIVLVILYFR